MATNYSTLLRNPTNIGDIFFSGSQSVNKGQPVIWVLDETWAFKTTEECAVSMNATPFVTMNAGQTFIIETGAKYIFDRDTVVALAYPQDVTQDIIIPNNIYNNNLDTIIIEADQSPIAKIVQSESVVTVGQGVVLDATTSYSNATPDATPLTYQWYIDGVDEGTAENFTYTTTNVGINDILLIVTDTEGRKADTTSTIAVNEFVPEQNIYQDSSQFSGATTKNGWTDIFYIQADVDTPNASNAVQFTAGFRANHILSTDTWRPSSLNFRIRINDVDQWTGTWNVSYLGYFYYWLINENATFALPIVSGDIIQLQVNWTDASDFAFVESACSGCVNGDFQMTSTEQIA